MNFGLRLQNIKFSSNGKRLLRYLSKYLLLACVVSLAFVPIYVVALTATRQNVINEVYSGFETGFTRTSGMLTNITNISYAIVRNQNTIQLSNVHGELETKDYMALKKAQEYMLNVLVTDNTVMNAYTLFKNNDIFLSKTMSGPDWHEIYDSFYQMDGVPADDWEEMVLNAKSRFEFLPSGKANWDFVPRESQSKKDTIHLAVPSPNLSTFKVNSVTVFVLDYQKFFSFFGSDELLANSFVYLTDSDENMMVAKNYSGAPLSLSKDIDQRTVDDVDYTIMKTKNAEVNMSAVIGIPESYFKEQVDQVWNFILLYAMLIILICILSSVVLAYYQNSPFKKMMESIQKVMSFPSDENNEYRYISDTILSLDSKSKQYEEEIRFMNASIYNNLLDRMLNGKIHTNEDEEKCRMTFGFLSEYFCVCIMRIWQTVPDSEEVDSTTKVNTVMRELFTEDIECPAYFYNGEVLKTSIIFNLPEESRSDLASFYNCINRVVVSVRERCGLEVVFGIGTIAFGIKRIGLSSTNAQDALRLSDKDTPVHTWFDRQKNRDDVFLESKMAQRLYEILLIGDQRYVDEYFDLLLRSLEKHSIPSETELRQSFYVIRNVLQSASYDILNAGEEIGLPEYSKERSALELFLSFRIPCLNLCNHVVIRQSEEDCRQKNEMIEYIKNNYTDSGLCAMSIADKYYVNEKYVFTIVKSQTGKSLGEFIEQLRFSKVEELLRDNVDINEIPERVGFNSVNTFYKAFKRIYGVSPGKWRCNTKL